MKRVTVTSLLPADAQDIWPLLTQIETLRYIAAPLASFEPFSDGEPTWQAHTTRQFRLRILGVLPMGVHTIHMRQLDAATRTICTEESNRWVPVWNHRITLEATGDHAATYTDTVEVDAGWRTGAISLWSRWFYRHRQRRWRKLLAGRQRGIEPAKP